MKISRRYEPLSEHIHPGKVLAIYGPRRVGKTTMIEKYYLHAGMSYLYISGDDIPSHEVFMSRSISKLKAMVAGYQILVIDEAQMIPSVGHALKILTDHAPHLRIVITGSSSLYLHGQIGEPLTGRKNTRILYPISELELGTHINDFKLDATLEERLLYGSYPEVLALTTPQEKQDYLKEIVGSYLLRDILSLDNSKSSSVIYDLLRLLAYQVGSLVSIHELAQRLSIDARTVKRYLDLFEQSYIIVPLRGWSTNMRNEVSKKSKYYFVDLGIRNELIKQYAPIALRQDIGALFENYIIIERTKHNAYTGHEANQYFWRLYSGGEVDYIEEKDGNLRGYEIKWTKQSKASPLWAKSYPQSTYESITRLTYHEFVRGRQQAR